VSHLQKILNKAERDGVIHRVRVDRGAPFAVPTGSGDASTMRPDSIDRIEPMGAPAATAVPELAPVKVVTGARLDSRLVAISSNGPAVEQYRALRTRILHSDSAAAVRVLLVTSPGRGEGKTLTAGNLALTMAQEYQRQTCLVEADLRHPCLQRLFGLPDGPGLADVLTGFATLDDALLAIDEYHITVLPAGKVPAHPAELLGTKAMRRVIETLRARFDRVVVDAPAAGPLADVRILTPLVDSVMLVVRSALTSKPSIHDAVSALDRAKLLGLLLNDADAA
jgi:capsular exopolysaccharide synthesis family protein